MRCLLFARCPRTWSESFHQSSECQSSASHMQLLSRISVAVLNFKFIHYLLLLRDRNDNVWPLCVRSWRANRIQMTVLFGDLCWRQKQASRLARFVNKEKKTFNFNKMRTHETIINWRLSKLTMNYERRNLAGVCRRCPVNLLFDYLTDTTNVNGRKMQMKVSFLIDFYESWRSWNRCAMT